MKLFHLLPIVPFAAIGALSVSSVSASPDGRWANAQEAYEKTCARCHLTGVGPELRGRELPAEYVKSVVRQGLLAMPAFTHASLDDATLDGVANLIATSRAPATPLALPATTPAKRP